MANGSYYPGEGIYLKIRFKHGIHIEQVRATFVHEKDEDARLEECGCVRSATELGRERNMDRNLIESLWRERGVVEEIEKDAA
jgi:hypothetical protein